MIRALAILLLIGLAGCGCSGGGAVHAATPVAATVRPICGGSVVKGQESWCTGIDKLALSDPQVQGPGGGQVSAGQAAHVQVLLSNGTAQDTSYPCVGFTTDNPDVSLTSENPSWYLYALLAGANATFSADAQIGPSVPPGTVVRFTAWVDVLHAGCTNGPQLQWNVTVN